MNPFQSLSLRRANSNYHLLIFFRLLEQVKPVDDKDTRIQLNLLLNDYYMKKGGNPSKLLKDMINLTSDVLTKIP